MQKTMNNQSIKKVTDASIEPLTLDAMKLHLRVDGTAEDDAITAYMKAARIFCEDYTGRAFINQTWRLKIDDFPSLVKNQHYYDAFIELPRAPLSSVTSITYIDADGNVQTLSTDIYDVDTDSYVGGVYLAYGQSYPATRNQRHAVTVTYVAGYGASASDVPALFIHAIKLLTGHFYEQREPVSFANNMYEVPFTVKSLLDMNKVMGL